MEIEERVKTSAACSSGVINFGKKQARDGTKYPCEMKMITWPPEWVMGHNKLASLEAGLV